MLELISQNLATILISLALAAVVILIVIKLLRDRKNPGCGCGCSGCSFSEECSMADKTGGSAGKK